MPEFGWSSIFGWSALVAIAAAAGNLIADVLKTYVSGVVIAKWQENQERQKLFHKYKNPIALSITELAHRLTEIEDSYPPEFLERRCLGYEKRKLSANSDSDEYYRKYKFVSSLYRFCSLLGWLELYRRDTIFLASGDDHTDKTISEALTRFRSAISDGHLNTFKDWREWKDHLVFREELRAVGESMCRLAGENYQVMGYADFESLVEKGNEGENRWLATVIDFFADPKNEKDFRRVRYCHMLLALCDLLDTLTKQDKNERLSKGYTLARTYLQEINYRPPS